MLVIGSGPSGAMAAHQLVRRGIPVTMLESGADRPGGALVRLAGRNVWRRGPALVDDPGSYVATGHPDTRWHRHLSPGGLSNHWTGAVPRFAPEDFVDGLPLGERYRWPLGYDELAPYYAVAERVLGVAGGSEDAPALPAGHVTHRRRLAPDWQRVADAARGHGQGLVPLPLADGPDWLAARRSTAFNSFTNVVGPLVGSPLFELRTGAHALQLEWCGRRRRVTAAVYADRATGAHVRAEADAVVVACGPLHSAKLLFDSACDDFAEGLGNGAGLLGRFLHDHPKEWWTFETDRPLSRPVPAAYLARRPYEGSSPLLATSWTIGHARPADRVLSFLPLKAGELGVQVFGTMVPTPENYVRPSRELVDEFGLPQLEVHIDFDADAVATVVDSRRHLLDLLGAAGHESRLRPVAPQLVPGDAVHYGGTVRMHDSPCHGVTDRWNRLHEVGNVLVTDASCFTTNTEKNPTLTAMALSARAADHLADELRSR